MPVVNLARCENMGSNPGVAESVARRAVELSTKAFGRGHPITAKAMLEQATALRDLGRTSEARELEKLAKTSLRNSYSENLARQTVDLRDLARKDRR